MGGGRKKLREDGTFKKKGKNVCRKIFRGKLMFKGGRVFKREGGGGRTDSQEKRDKGVSNRKKSRGKRGDEKGGGGEKRGDQKNMNMSGTSRVLKKPWGKKIEKGEKAKKGKGTTWGENRQKPWKGVGRPGAKRLELQGGRVCYAGGATRVFKKNWEDMGRV